MANIYTSVRQLIGNTPLLELGNFAAAHGAKARILGTPVALPRTA